jgi:hypothetical protein
VQPFGHRPQYRVQPFSERHQQFVDPEQGGLADAGPPDHQPGDGQRARSRQPLADQVEPVGGRLERLCRGVQLPAQDLIEVETGHASRSSTLRSADMARAV